VTDRQRIVFHAALVRVVLSIFAVVALPVLYPALAAQRPILAAYVGVTCVMQLLVWKDIGGSARSLVTGLVDIVYLTWLVHRVGSMGTMMVALYVLAAIMNTLVVRLRVAIVLAAIGAAGYAGSLYAEHAGWLAYGPDAPVWANGMPGGAEMITAGVLLAIIQMLSATVTGLLVRELGHREAQLLDANAKLEILSARDPLTQLYNRRYLMSRLEAELARVRRGHELAVLMIDLDGFKRVNDKQGHLRGDLLLEQIGGALAGAVRETDVAGRYGGDEFIVILPDTDLEHAQAVAERLTSAARGIGVRFDASQPVTASVGVGIAHAEDGVAAVVRRADENAYRAKQAGGNRVAG
jgi:diguanylate cyclase (GGDEF)-like protein